MANEKLTYQIDVEDKASKEFAKVGQEFDKVAAKAEKARLQAERMVLSNEKLAASNEKLRQQTEKLGTQNEKLSLQNKKLKNDVDELQNATSKAGMSFGKLVAVFAVAQVAVSAFQSVINTTTGIASSAFNMGRMASSLEELGISAQVAGQRVGYSSKEIRDTITQIELLNISSASATKFVAEMGRAQIDLSKSVKVAAAAQNLAVVAQMSTSEAVSRVTHAIQTGMPMVLAQMGITMSATEMFDRYGNTIGKAGKDLTDLEKRQAIANAVVEQGAQFADLYSLSLATAEKSLRSLIDRGTMMQEALGQMFKPLLDTIIPQLNTVVTGFTIWLKSNEETLNRFGQVIANVVTGPLRGFLDMLQNIFQPLLDFQRAARNGKEDIGGVSAALEEVNRRMQVLIPHVNAAGNFFMFFVGAGQVVFGVLKRVSAEIVLVVRVIGALLQIGTEMGRVLGSYVVKAVEALGARLPWLGQSFSKIGETVMHVLGQLQKFAQTVGSAVGQLLPDELRNGLQKLGSAVVDYSKVVVDGNKTILNGFGNMNDSLQGKAFDFEKLMESLPPAVASAASGVDVGMGQMSEAIEKRGGEGVEKLRKVLEDIAKEVENFNRNIANKTLQFEQSLRDLVTKHRDTIRDLRSQLQQLNDDFAQASRDRAEDHQDKRNGIMKKYEDETKTLKDNLARRLTDSKGSDEQLIAFFEAQISEKERLMGEELRKEEEKFAKEEAKQQASFQKQLNSLQTKLNASLEIEKKHRADFEQFKDAVAEDDITRLKSNFEREMGELKRQHDDRMNELRKQQEEILAVKTATSAGAAKAVQQAVQNRGVSVTSTPNIPKNVPTAFSSGGGHFSPATPMTRRHSGGFVNGVGEVPILAKAGEYVMPQQQMQALMEILGGLKDGAVGGGIQMTNHIYEKFDFVGAMREAGWRARI